MVDNCTVHILGDNVGLRETLMRDYGIIMITLPPYHSELNSTELVFNTLLLRLRNIIARYNSTDMPGFETMPKKILDSISVEDVIAFYNFCGYYLYLLV